MRRVTFSRSFTLSLSRTRRCRCEHCASATSAPHLYTPEEVQRLLDDAERRGAKELLVLACERPEVDAERLRAYGHEDLTSYVAWACERALERGLLAHTNVGVLSRADLARLRDVTASQRLMLESLAPDLEAHGGSPTRRHERRLETIRAAGELRIPFTTGILVGIGETPADRLEALAVLAQIQREHGHIQEVILRSFVAQPRCCGAEPPGIADAEQRSRTHAEPPGIADAEQRSRTLAEPTALTARADPVSLEEMRALVRACRRLMPEVVVQVPPSPSDWWLPLIAEAAPDLGGLSANGDRSSPEHRSPSVHRLRKQLVPHGCALTERLCVHPRYISPDWLEQGVLDVIKLRYWSFIPRRGSGRREQRPVRRDLVPGVIAKGRDGAALDVEELTCLFSETRPEAIEDLRQAADELRRELAGDTVTFVVNRNINVSNICTVGCAFCGFGQGRRSPDAYEHSDEELVRRVHEAVDFGASEICMQSGIHPEWTLDDYERLLRLAKRTAPALHLHAYSPMEVDAMAVELPLGEVFARLREAGLGSTPGTAAEVLHDGVRERISPNKLPVGRWVEIIEAAHASGLRSTATVMFGHVEEPSELAEHMRIVRALQERTGGFTEFVPLSFIPYHTLLGRTHGIEEISREENLKHTAVFRLALGRTIPNLQASWVKMGLDAATEALRWGVNDLGGTLMEESISRMAGSRHGTMLVPAQLIGAAHAAGRPAAERTTLYEIREDHPLRSAAATARAGESVSERERGEARRGAGLAAV